MGKQTVEAASSKSFLMFAQQSIGRPLSSEKKKKKNWSTPEEKKIKTKKKPYFSWEHGSNHDQ